MNLFKHIVVAAFALLLAAGVTSARSLTEAERSDLAAIVEKFDAAMRGEDFETGFAEVEFPADSEVVE